ncbi:MAG: class I SAM-dependent methyltransferase [Thermoplasmata archaeon]
MAHPLQWSRYIWKHEVLHQEVPFVEHPRFGDWGPMYRASRKPLAEITGVAPVALDGFFAELEPLHHALETEVGSLPASGALWQAPLLYVLVRAVRPRWLIESGISAGYSSRFLLEALVKNGGEGHLDSIGIARFALGNVSETDRQRVADRPIGWLVPSRFEGRWTRHVGRSDEILPGLLAGRPPELDLFLHDSLHDYTTMHYEYETVWSHIRPGGWVLSHDIHSSEAWPEFLAAHAILKEAELDHDLGAARALT